MDINQRLQQGTASIFQKTRDKLMKVSPGTVGATVFAACTPVIYYAVGTELSFHIEMSKTLGAEAYAAFTESVYPDGALKHLAAGLKGELATPGGNLLVQGGVGAVLAGITAGVATHLTQQFVNAKRILSQISPAERDRLLAREQMADQTDRPRGATPVAEDDLRNIQSARREVSLRGQLMEGLAAISDSVKGPTSKTTHRGPRM